MFLTAESACMFEIIQISCFSTRPNIHIYRYICRYRKIDIKKYRYREIYIERDRDIVGDIDVEWDIDIEGDRDIEEDKYIYIYI